MPQKVIITGTNGMDGAEMAKFLLKNTDYLIFGLARCGHSNLSNLEEATLHNPRFKIICGDLTKHKTLQKHIKEISPDFFINFAGCTLTQDSWKSPFKSFETNTLGVLACLHEIKHYAPKCRFLNASSIHIFGKAVYQPQDLNHPLDPRTPYAASKAAANQIVEMYRNAGLFAVNAILAGHEGPQKSERFVSRKITKAIARFVCSMNGNRKPIETLRLGNLNSERDWGYTEDFIEAIWLILNQEKPKDYIISTGELHTVREFLEVCLEHGKTLTNRAGYLGPYYYFEKNDNYYTSFRGISMPGTKESKDIIRHKNDPFNWDFPIVISDSNAVIPPESNLLGNNSELRALGWKPKTGFQDIARKMLAADIALLTKT